MRGTASLLALVVALCACGDDTADGPVTDASTRLDAKVNDASVDAKLFEACGALAACQSGVLTQLNLCLGAFTSRPAGDLWSVCVVDPQGRAAIMAIREDQRITSTGWTYSTYGDLDATLTDQGTSACVAEREKLIIATEDNLPTDGGSLLCYRRDPGNGDD